MVTLSSLFKIQRVYALYTGMGVLHQNDENPTITTWSFPILVLTALMIHTIKESAILFIKPISSSGNAGIYWDIEILQLLERYLLLFILIVS